MEVTIGEYGRMMFEMMVGGKKNMPDHWKSIANKAEPLVRELIKLNDEMKPGSYDIIGYKGTDGKKKLSKHERIRLAQKRLWGTKAGTLKEGERLWLCSNYDIEMYIGEQSPAPVEFVKKDSIAIEMQGCNYEYMVRVDADELVLKAPDDFFDKEEEYTSDKFWLEQADELGI